DLGRQGSRHRRAQRFPRGEGPPNTADPAAGPGAAHPRRAGPAALPRCGGPTCGGVPQLRRVRAGPDPHHAAEPLDRPWPAAPAAAAGRGGVHRRLVVRRVRDSPYAARMSRAQRLIVVLVLNLALVVGLVVVGVTAHSIAVLAEGGDYLLDAAGVCVALLAIWLAGRPATRTRPEGYPNATSVAALINAGWLLILELLVGGVALDRLSRDRVTVDGLPVLVMSGVAAVTMLVGALILRADEDDDEGGERDLSVAAVLLDTVADAAAAAGVAVVGAIIFATGGWY